MINVAELLVAGAELRPLARLPFLEVHSGEPAAHQPNVALFILRAHGAQCDEQSHQPIQHHFCPTPRSPIAQLLQAGDRWKRAFGCSGHADREIGSRGRHNAR